MNMKLVGVSILSAAVLFGCSAEGDKESRMGTKGNDYEQSAHNEQNYNAQKDGFNQVNYDNGPYDGQMNNGQDYGEENVGNEDTYKDDDRRYSVANKVADKITADVDQVKRAYVLKTDRNAYVAVVKKGETTKELNDDLKKKIAKAAKSADKDINNVFVSANPDFFDMTGDYVQNVQNGKPVRGFFDEFGQMIKRIFPEAK
ncbi:MULTISPECIES: YhcN/YlaJ family sporulation lipoprotein [Pontibacillus]|uniref:YhcN/YlaJ family sporulation lipoprotein n=1 Tax=Pontibacillus chungwhensis TaxID=265426 RepID=A0ABY8UYS6_9BACI|nr:MULTISPECIES: YhcN/YlaJ family sporulation lipoprotein [Pontibacillus]MCD5324860.1 YhcN/YlaJ family sporulation lipoprotein [Pontibacillus sp. HN14]WIF98820.1 YhcN/YlaJ family sporulation lipoprotein [Pontibacillus chungwhensis]